MIYKKNLKTISAYGKSRFVRIGADLVSRKKLINKSREIGPFKEQYFLSTYPVDPVRNTRIRIIVLYPDYLI